MEWIHFHKRNEIRPPEEVLLLIWDFAHKEPFRLGYVMDMGYDEVWWRFLDGSEERASLGDFYMIIEAVPEAYLIELGMKSYSKKFIESLDKSKNKYRSLFEK